MELARGQARLRAIIGLIITRKTTPTNSNVMIMDRRERERESFHSLIAFFTSAIQEGNLLITNSTVFFLFLFLLLSDNACKKGF